MSVAKSIYHRFIPESVRTPFGRVRRALSDRLTRALSASPLPPESLLLNVQMTPYVSEFIRVGRRSARAIEAAMLPLLDQSTTPIVLDFGCRCGQTLLHVRERWTLHGCDIDKEAIAWLRKTIDEERFRTNYPSPPLPWPEGSFDAAYAVSVFTHFSDAQHSVWKRELARVLRPGAVLAVTTMGPGVLSSFPTLATEENHSKLSESGFFFVPASASFNANAAFHTVAGLSKQLLPQFELVASSERGLDGFQDLSVFRRA